MVVFEEIPITAVLKFPRWIPFSYMIQTEDQVLIRTNVSTRFEICAGMAQEAMETAVEVANLGNGVQPKPNERSSDGT